MTSGEQRTLAYGTSPRYVETGHLVFGRNGALWASRFDLSRLEVIGEPLLVVEGVFAALDWGYASYDVSISGALAYVPQTDQSTIVQRSLVWVDREGREESVAVEPRPYRTLSISPDGTRVALDVGDPDNRDIWIIDLARGTSNRFTFDPAQDSYPLWTPDGTRIAFSSARGGGLPNIYWKDADGTGQVERLTESENFQTPQDFTPDGQTLVFAELAAGTAVDLGNLALSGERGTEPLLKTIFRDSVGVVSPDGRWLAYVSDESGEDQVYVRPYPNVDDGKWQMSPGFGVSPQWGSGSDELFYQTTTDTSQVRLMMVSNDGEPGFRPSTPVQLFEGSYVLGEAGAFHSFDVSPDGQRFLMLREVRDMLGASEHGYIVVVQHWTKELKRLVPVD